MAGPLDRPGQLPLMACTEAGLPSGSDFPPFAQETTKGFRVLVVNLRHVFGTKNAPAHTPPPLRLRPRIPGRHPAGGRPSSR